MLKDAPAARITVTLCMGFCQIGQVAMGLLDPIVTLFREVPFHAPLLRASVNSLG